MNNTFETQCPLFLHDQLTSRLQKQKQKKNNKKYKTFCCKIKAVHKVCSKACSNASLKCQQSSAEASSDSQPVIMAQ